MARRRQKLKNQKPRFPKSLAIFFIFVLVTAGGIYVMTLPIWKIKEVVVNGAQMLLPEEIRTLAAIPISENLFFTSFSRAKANLQKITAIKSYHFYRIPPATVLISITERRPLATIVFPDKTIIIDSEGYIINRNQNLTLNIPNRADLPVVSGIGEEIVLKSDHIDKTVSQIVSEIIFKLSPYLESGRMQLELGELKNVSLLLDDILRVKVGAAEDIKRKMEVFAALLPVIAGKWGQVEYVDVRFPDNPVIRFQ
ncbi:MAG: FtsQ-type POTRA domain-containing protein [Candidatus Margulisbacteria bacterium]|nr:FtsQ-type POTRA domain-containing protein [Candidatus Margulisiibacteriota bacterium]